MNFLSKQISSKWARCLADRWRRSLPEIPPLFIGRPGVPFVAAVLGMVLLSSTPLSARQSADPVSIAGSWAGTLVIGRDEFDLTFNLTEQDDSYSAALISRQLGIYGMPAEVVTLENNRLTIRLDLLAAEYTGRVRLDDSGEDVAYIDGEWFQEGEMVPIILRPATGQ